MCCFLTITFGGGAVHLTAPSEETRRTEAVKSIDSVMAAAAVKARPAGAVVQIPLTVLPSKTRSALTFVTVHQILAGKSTINTKTSFSHLRRVDESICILTDYFSFFQVVL